MKRQLAGVTLVALAALQGCKTGYNRTHTNNPDPNPPECATTYANDNLSSQGVNVFNLVAGLTCASNDYEDGYMIGQSVGFGNQLNNPASLNDDDPNNHSYDRLITGFDDLTTHTPAVIAMDYEGDRLYSEEDLLDANETLVNHWNDGGLVSITWKPLSPWRNSADNIDANSGTADDLLFSEDDDIDLAALVEEGSAAYTIWQRKLDAMVVALKDLQEEGVVVLWRPLPEMNSDTFWWGTSASDTGDEEQGADLYTALWLDMFNYFQDQGLNNLLWVYSPAESTNDYSVSWAYPGDDYVDVVAGIARNDALIIEDYQALVDLGRPLAMAEYGPDPEGILTVSGLGTERGHFDNTLYADRLKESYPAVAYWVSNHSSQLEPSAEGEPATRSNLALVDNQRSKDLTDRSYIISREIIVENDMRD